MALPLSRPPPLAPPAPPRVDAVGVPTFLPEGAIAGAETVARGESRDALWFVRVVLVASEDLRVQSVRVVIDDRTIRRIELHTVWTEWHLVPLLAAYVPATPFAAGETEASATALAGVILASLRHDAAACLSALGTPLGSLPEPEPGRQERAALRYNRDAARAWQWIVTPRPAPRPGQRGRR